MPYHVERSKLFVMDRIGKSHLLDALEISRAIEFTRFPISDEPVTTKRRGFDREGSQSNWSAR